MVLCLVGGCSDSSSDSAADTPFCSLLFSYPSYRLEGVDLVAYSEVELPGADVQRLASSIGSLEGVADVESLTPDESASEFQRVQGGPLFGDSEAPTQPFPATYYVRLEAGIDGAAALELRDKLASIEDMRQVNIAIDWPPGDREGERAAALAAAVSDDLRSDLEILQAPFVDDDARLLEVQDAATRIRHSCS